MRRALVFLLVLGLGLGLLLWLRARERTGTTRPVVPPIEQGELPPLVELPTVEEQGTEEGVQVGLSGRLELSVYPRGEPEEPTATRPRLYHLLARDSRTLGDEEYELTDARFELFDPEDGELVATLNASRAVVRLHLVDLRVESDRDEDARLWNVEVTLLRNAPVVPMTVRVPYLQGAPDPGRFHSDDRVQILAEGLEAQGLGLELDLEDQRFALRKEGRVDIDLENGERATLEAVGEGPIEVDRLEESLELELRALDGARAVFRGREEYEVGGRAILLRGPAERGAGFVARRAEVRGQAVVSGLGHVFRAAEAELAFDERGEPLEARLSGDPTGSVRIGRYLQGVRPELFAERAEVAGAGPLVVGLGPRTRVRLEGPGSIVVPEKRLAVQAGGLIEAELSGRDERDEAPSSFAAAGGVRLTLDDRVLTADAVDVVHVPGADGPRYEITTRGPTRVEGSDRLQRRVVLEAAGGASLVAEGERRVVREARDVRLEVEGTDGFVARAASVRDLDLDQRVFEAEGDVTYEIEAGRGRAQRVRSLGEGRIELEGTAGAPASFELWRIERPEAEGRLNAASASAREIAIERGAVHARGDVVADVLTVDRALRLECGELDVRYQDPPRDGRRTFKALARGDVVVREESDGSVGRLGGDEIELGGMIADDRRSGDTPESLRERVERTRLSARGNVWFDLRERLGLRGEGDLLSWSEDGRARLSAGVGRRVRAFGAPDAGGSAFELTADWVEFDGESLEAGNPELQPATELPGAGVFQGKGRDGAPPARAPGPAQGLLGLRGKRFVARRGVLELVGDAHVEGRTPRGERWSVDAGAIEVRGRWDERTRRVRLEDVESIEAREGFTAALGDRLRASGRRLRAEGTRLRIEGLPGQLDVQGVRWTSNNLEFDQEQLLIETGNGRIEVVDPEQPLRWVLEYESMQPLSDVDATILAVRQPVFRSAATGQEIRASWALAWIDRERWRRNARQLFGLGGAGDEGELFVEEAFGEEQAASGDAPIPAEQERLEELFQLVRELYLEDNIEYLKDGRRLGRASALYLDRLDGNGWLYEGDVLIDLEVSGRPQTLRAQAQWMRLSADLRTRRLEPIDRLQLLEAERAVISFCEFDVPDYVIETGELRIRRDDDSPLGFQLTARKNKARLRGFGTSFDIPLPPLGVDEEGNFSFAGVEFGNSARFGSVLTLGASWALSEGIKEGIGDVFQSETSEVRGSTRFQAGWLGSRGPLIGLGQTVGIGDRVWLSGRVDGIPDGGRDRGLVRVPEDERDELRSWLNARGRLYLDPDEWVDLAFNYQTDAGVQSEFYEGEFTTYEERDNFLHWRKAQAQYLVNASVKVRLESFRTDVEELPKLGFTRGLTPAFDLLGRPVLYTSDVQLAYLRRREGEAPFSPFFVSTFADGLGDREVLRVDTPHRLDYPVPLGFGGLVLTPFTSLRGTFWNEGLEQEDPAGRLESFVGAEVATTFWRRWGEDYLHEVTPSLAVRSEVLEETGGDEPVVFDARDLDADGQVLDFGLRNVWRRPGLDPIKSERLDVEVRGSWTSEGAGDGLLPLAVLGHSLYFLNGVPIGLTHDGRYDLESGETVYSATGFGFEPHPRWTVGAGYNQGRELDGDALYRSAGVTLRFRATPKWTLEWSQAIGLLPGTGDESRVVVRRFGHDFVTELQLDERTGEGFSIGISVRPLVGWKRRPLGLIDDWLGVWR